MSLDAAIQKFQNLPSFNIYTFQENVPVPWYEVRPAEVAQELVIREISVEEDAYKVAAQVLEWGRLVALAQRVWEVQQRRLRTWKAHIWVKIMEDFEKEEKDPKTGKPIAKKKPTEKHIEALYRVNPEYEVWNREIERAAEALNSAQTALDAFKAKRDMLRAFATKTTRT